MDTSGPVSLPSYDYVKKECLQAPEGSCCPKDLSGRD